VKRSASSADALKLDNQLCFALYAASRAMTAAYRPLLEALGLTYPQYLVMLVLWETGGSTVKDLGTALRLDSGTLSPLLKRLEAAGFLERRRSSEDERVVEVAPSEAGRDLKRKAMTVPHEMACRARLNEREIAALRTELQRLERTLSEDQKPEGQKPEGQKPEDQKPEGQKPE
jgi:DNA-binding MarR family transcriptional regulator